VVALEEAILNICSLSSHLNVSWVRRSEAHTDTDEDKAEALERTNELLHITGDAKMKCVSVLSSSKHTHSLTLLSKLQYTKTTYLAF
jgi:hypothetical protein